MIDVKRWFQAIKDNDLKFVEANVHSYKKVTDTSYPYFTGLMQATAAGQTRMVRLLVNYEARTTTRTGWTALMAAAETNNLAIVRLLIPHEGGMQTTRPTNHYRVGTTALLIAASKGHIEIVKALYESEAKASSWGSLFLAAIMHSSDDVKAALGEASVPPRVDVYNRTPLMYCIMHKRPEAHALPNDSLEITRIVETLGPLYEGVTDFYGKTGLIYAAEANNTIAIEAILSYAPKEIGCKTISVDGKTALMIAAELGYTKVCSLLLASEKRMMTSKGFTALMYATVNGHADIVQLLMPLEADMHILEDNPPFLRDMTALDMAKALNLHQIVELLQVKDTALRKESYDAPSINLDRGNTSQDYSRASEMSNFYSVKSRHAMPDLRGIFPQQPEPNLWSPSASHYQGRVQANHNNTGAIDNGEDDLITVSPHVSKVDLTSTSMLSSIVPAVTPTVPKTEMYSILDKLKGGVATSHHSNWVGARGIEDFDGSVRTQRDASGDELGRFLTRKQLGTGSMVSNTVQSAVHFSSSTSTKLSDARPNQTHAESQIVVSSARMAEKKPAALPLGVPPFGSSQNKALGRLDGPMDSAMTQITEELKTTKQLLNKYAADNMKLLDTINDLRGELQQEMDDKQILLTKLTALKSRELASQSAIRQCEDYEARYLELKRKAGEADLKQAELYTENIELKGELDEVKRQIDSLLVKNDMLQKQIDRMELERLTSSSHERERERERERDSHTNTPSNLLSRSTALGASGTGAKGVADSKLLAADIDDLKDELAQLQEKKEMLMKSAEQSAEKTRAAAAAYPQHILDDVLVDHHKLLTFIPKYNKYIHTPALPETIKAFLINNKLFLNDFEVEKQENERLTDYVVYLREEISSLKERIGKYESSLMSRGAK